MSADEYMTLPECSAHYELLDGVVIEWPSYSVQHQRVVLEIACQFFAFLETHPVGQVVHQVDVRVTNKIVYCPDVILLSNEKAARVTDRVNEIPDLVVEVISPLSRACDAITKRHDYEAAGVGEYWLIDLLNESFTFLVLKNGVYVEVSLRKGRYASEVVTGFQLDIERVRRIS